MPPHKRQCKLPKSSSVEMLVQPEPAAEQATLQLSKSQLIHDKNWMRRVRRFKIAMGPNNTLGKKGCSEVLYWIGCQCFSFKLGRMPLRRLELLEQEGFDWPLDKVNWIEMLTELTQFKHDNKTCNVPFNDGHNSLALWLVLMRVKKAAGKLPIAHVEQLEELEIDWDWVPSPRVSSQDIGKDKKTKSKKQDDIDDPDHVSHHTRREWKYSLSLLTTARRENKVIGPNHKLHHWQIRQRSLFRIGDLSRERLEAMIGADFVFIARGQSKKDLEHQEAMSKQLVAYFDEHGHCNVPFNEGSNALALWLEWLRITKNAETLEESVLDKLNGLGVQIDWNWSDPSRVVDMQQEDDDEDSSDDEKEEPSDSNNDRGHALDTQSPNAWDGKFESRVMDLEVYAPMVAAPAPIAAPTQRAAADPDVVAGLFAFGGAAAASSFAAPSAAPFMAPVVAHVAATVHGNYDGDGVRNAARPHAVAALELAMHVRKRSIETHKTQGESAQKAMHAGKKQRQGSFDDGAETEANDSWNDKYQQLKECQNAVTLAFELVKGSSLQRWCETQQALFARREDGDLEALSAQRFQRLKELGICSKQKAPPLQNAGFREALHQRSAFAAASGSLGLLEMHNQNPFPLSRSDGPGKAEQTAIALASASFRSGLPEMLNQIPFPLLGNVDPIDAEQITFAPATASDSLGLPEALNQNPFTLSGNVGPGEAEQTAFALATASGSLGLPETLNQNPFTLLGNIVPGEQTALASATADIHRSNLDLPVPIISLVNDGNVDPEAELKAAAMAHLFNGVLRNSLIQEAMKAWGVTSPEDFYFLSPEFLASPHLIQGRNKTLPLLQQLRILDCIRWSFEQENQAIETWFNLDEAALLTFQRRRFTS
ncbi:hypothetical protein MPSEU_000024800 [Mayamaea pseudoterrestris]|nr:hypothetical protein MPSEU_000024800 [Mayamaea pseudoterrestris]